MTDPPYSLGASTPIAPGEPWLSFWLALALGVAVCLFFAILFLRAKSPASAPVVLAELLFRLVQYRLPKRISDEEIGDALELIARFVAEGRPRRFIYLKIATTIFWVLVHTVRDWIARLLVPRKRR